MSDKDELERKIAALKEQIDDMSEIIADVDGSTPVASPDPKAVRQSMIADLADLKSRLLAMDD